MDLDRTQQAMSCAPAAGLRGRRGRARAQVVLAAVPDHGIRNGGGRAFTSVATDNDDLGTVEQVAEILAANSRYGHVAVHLADDYVA